MIQKFYVIIGFWAFCVPIWGQPDFNQAGKIVLELLPRVHYSKHSIGDLSKEILDHFIDRLDPSRIIFYQSDVDEIKSNYQGSLSFYLASGNSQVIASGVYKKYLKRLENRVDFAYKLLEKEFDFSSQEFIEMSRKELPWVDNQEEADKLWRKLIKQQVLSEVLRQKLLVKRAQKLSKENALRNYKPEYAPKEFVRLRYQRLLSSVYANDEEDIADYFLGALAQAYDPHTDYLSPREWRDFQTSMTNSLVGIGVLLSQDGGRGIKVKGIVVGGPADQQGQLKLNDRIIGVDSLNNGEMQDIMFLDTRKVVEKIRGKRGTSVKLKVESSVMEGGGIKFVVIPRQQVKLKDALVQAQIIHIKQEWGSVYKIGWIKIPSFYNNLSEDLKKLLTRIGKEKVTGLILDLRGNGGGLVDEVRKTAGLFLEVEENSKLTQEPIVQVASLDGRIKAIFARDDYYYQQPMVVVTDEFSASASEILAGVLQDYGRAVIIGSTSTFGKGTVQGIFSVKGLSRFFGSVELGYLKSTTQKYYRVSGESVQLKGVTPDLILPSVYGGSEIGERYEKNPLDYDVIEGVLGFDKKVFNRNTLKKLILKSHSRVQASNEFRYYEKLSNRVLEKRKKNLVSLNINERLEENSRLEDEQSFYFSSLRKQYFEQEKDDQRHLKIFRLNLDLVNQYPLPQVDAKLVNNDYMRLAGKEDSEKLSLAPKFPSQIDPVKRESIQVIIDLLRQSKESWLWKKGTS